MNLLSLMSLAGCVNSAGAVVRAMAIAIAQSPAVGLRGCFAVVLAVIFELAGLAEMIELRSPPLVLSSCQRLQLLFFFETHSPV